LIFKLLHLSISIEFIFGPLLLQGHVVCKQLGFTLGAENITMASAYGLVNDTYSYYNFACLGDEVSLHSCPHADTLADTLIHGAGVVCGKHSTLGSNSSVFSFTSLFFVVT
jgi:hypothetical protein